MRYRIDKAPVYSVLKIWLDPGEYIWAEPGAMMLMKGEVRIETKAYGGIVKALKRALFGGESIMMNKYEARGPAEVWLVPPTPGDIATLELDSDAWIVQDTSYLAHTGEIDVDVAWRGFRGLIAEGELIWLRLRGHGLAWISSYGAIERVELKPGERIIVDNFHFVAMNADAKWRVRKFGGWKSFLFGGEGLVLEVEGPATLYLQTRMLPVFAELLQKYLPKS